MEITVCCLILFKHVMCNKIICTVQLCFDKPFFVSDELFHITLESLEQVNGVGKSVSIIS